jgi:hypothetical protein
MGTLFWLDNPKVLLNKNEIFEIWPFIGNNISLEAKLNSFTRTILLLTIIFYIFNRKLIILFTSFITIGFLVIIYYLKRNKEKFENRNSMNLIKCIKENTKYKMPTNTNPLSNTLLTSLPSKPNPLYNDDTNYKQYKSEKAPPSFNKKIKKKIDKKSKNIKIKNKLYNYLGNTTNFNMFMRQFYTMPNTEIPSNQGKFAEFCYGNMNTRKKINDYTK